MSSYTDQAMDLNIEGQVVALGKPPSARQQDFINAFEKEQLFGGAKRGGKTWVGAMKGVMLSTLFPGNKGYILRQDLTDLRESTLETFLRVCPPELIIQHNHTEHWLTIRTSGVPSKVIYSGLSDQTDEESSKGKEAGWIWIDEPSEIKLNTYLMYLAQLCWELPPCKCRAMDKITRKCPLHPNNGGYPPFMALLTTNPEAGWVEDRFQSLIEQAGDHRPMVTNGKQVFVRSLPKDNIYLPPGWENELRNGNTPEIWIKKYLDGVWGSVEGQVFKAIDERYHFVHESEIPPAYLKTLSLVGCLDHASTGVTCATVTGIDPDGNLIVLGSYYSRDHGEEFLISQHGAQIRQLCDNWAIRCKGMDEKYAGKNFGQWPCLDYFEYFLIDPSTQAKTQMSNNELTSIQDLYWRVGLPTQAAHNTLSAGVDLLQEYFHIKPTHIHPWKNERPSPSLFIIQENNRSGIKELRGWKIVLNDRGERKYVGPDHWIDDVRYTAMSRPEPPRFTRKDILFMDTHAQKATKAMQSFDKKFGTEPNPDQWFPGGSPSNTWFPERLN